MLDQFFSRDKTLRLGLNPNLRCIVLRIFLYHFLGVKRRCSRVVVFLANTLEAL